MIQRALLSWRDPIKHLRVMEVYLLSLMERILRHGTIGFLEIRAFLEHLSINMLRSPRLKKHSTSAFLLPIPATKPRQMARFHQARYLWTDQTYLVDSVNQPEPLNSILRGIHTALEEFETRSVRGDEVGVVAFDDNILASRSTSKTVGGVEYAAMVPPQLSDPEFRAMYEATDVDGMGLQDKNLPEVLTPKRIRIGIR